MSALEDLLVRCCAPTLAGIKTAGLFTAAYEERSALLDKVRELNRRLRGRGLRLLPLRCREGRALLYVYRPDRLSEDLDKEDVSALLSSLGYPRSSPGNRLACLHRRLLEGGPFPHEIGLFLGYPAEDVDGFIRHEARDCKCSGCWKVYGDAEKAKRDFASFRRCTERCCALRRQGFSLEAIMEMEAKSA